MYDNLKIGEFMDHIASFSGNDVADLKARAIEESQIRRIDNKHWNKQTKESNTLRDLKIRDNTAILVENKDQEEIQKQNKEVEEAKPSEEP